MNYQLAAGMQYYSIFNYLSFPPQQQANIVRQYGEAGQRKNPGICRGLAYGRSGKDLLSATCCIFLLTLSMTLLVAPGQAQSNKKVIEFGWDYPTMDYLRKHLPAMEQRPFDGVVFSFQPDIMEVFRPSPLPDSYFQWDALASLPFRKFTHNFFFIRLQSSDGAHWYDDAKWQIIEANTERLSLAVKTGKVKGCLLDPEYYGEDPLKNPWTYSPQQYPGRSFQQVKEQVRMRGSQFMRALQRHQRSQELLCLWIAGLVLADQQSMRPEQTRQALLPSFCEGMWMSKDTGIHIIDGNELSYWYRSPVDFLEKTAALMHQSKAMMHPREKGKDSIDLKMAQAVFYDGLFATHPSFDQKLGSEEKSNWHQQNLRFALATTDKYLWYYTERMNCWNEDAWKNAAMQHLKQLYEEIHDNPGTGSKQAVAYKYTNQPPMRRMGASFTATYIPTTGELRLIFPKSSTARINVYQNYSRIATTELNRKNMMVFQLPASLVGSIITEAIFSNGERAYAIPKW